MLAYKAETDSLRAAVDSAQKAEKVKERAMQRRFDALESSLTAMENTAKAWKQRALAVEDMLKRVKEKGLDVLRVEGALDGLLNGGRMDVMLGDPKLKRLVLAQGPRRERPEWLRRKSTAGIELPPLKLEEDVDEVVEADIPLDLPAPDVVWSIVEHQVGHLPDYLQAHSTLLLSCLTRPLLVTSSSRSLTMCLREKQKLTSLRSWRLRSRGRLWRGLCTLSGLRKRSQCAG